jgi:hypothetical protein
MYTVYIENECACFKKSEYESEKSFQTQQDAYNYSNILVELMNEEFCSKHLFTSQKMDGDVFLIKVSDNPNSGSSCGTSSASSCSSGSCGCE